MKLIIYLFVLQCLFLYITRIACLFEYCDYNLQLNASQKIYVNSPFYPSKYPPGTSCRYRISAPSAMHLTFNCNINFDKDTSSCSTEFFYFNRDGSTDLPGSEFFCGQGIFTRRSFLNNAVISYISTGRTTAGSFSCLIQVQSDDCNCGRTNNLKIAGGTEASINEFPSMAGIVHLDYQKIFCGAVIIQQRYLLSAAHCFISPETSNLSKLTVLVGANDVTKIIGNLITKFYEIDNIKLHENFTPQTVQNDIALIRTKRNIIWDNGIGPACLPFKFLTNNLPDNSKLQLAGWGTTSFGGEQSLKLLKTTLDIIRQDYCRSVISQLSSNQLCTYTFGKDACQFDSGGGLYYNEDNMYVFGIISFGYSCATNLPSVNTRVTSFLPWIQRNTLNAQFCMK